MMCGMKNKCSWCKLRKDNVVQIKKWCKYYKMYICEECYEQKLNQNTD